MISPRFVVLFSSCVVTLALMQQQLVESFTIITNNSNNNNRIPSLSIPSTTRTTLQMAQGEIFDFEVSMPPSTSGLTAQMKIQSILDGPSKLIEVRYKLPFSPDISPQQGLAVCTKDGPKEDGEKVGDILHYSSQWTMGLPRGDGIFSTAASFSGAIGWQCSLFDVMKANKWNEVVEALVVSNTPQRTDEVDLIFERPMQEEEE